MSVKTVKTYSFEQVVVYLRGIRIVGYGDGGIKLEPQSDLAEIVRGPDGHTTIIEKPDPLWMCTLNIAQGSNANAILFAETRAGSSFDFVVKDLRGTKVFAAVNCKVTKLPSVEFSGDTNDMEWVIMMPKVEYILGGNNTAQSVLDLLS